MSFFTPESIRSASRGVYRSRPGRSGPAHGVGIDTRTLRPGQVFAAFRGEHVDGHDFIQQAYEAGSRISLVERGAAISASIPDDMALIEVESTRAALGRMALAYRKTLASTRVIAVTGSNGKTTTVRLIDQILGSHMAGSASQKSYNNDIGLPLTLLNARRTDKYVVCEVGMSSPGEIARLGQIARPDIGVITSIGRAHLAGLGSVDAVAREKAQLIRAVSSGGLAVVPAEAPGLEVHLLHDGPMVRFGVGDAADLRVSDIEPGASGVSFVTNGGQRYELGLLGRHNAFNAAAAIAVARRFGMDEQAIAAALAGAHGPAMRLDRVQIGPTRIVNDAYNANPDSVLAALDAAAATMAGADRRVLVLGEMLELGEASVSLHEEVGAAVASLIRRGDGPELVVLVGSGAASARAPIVAELGPAGVVLEPKTGDGRSIAQRLRPGDAVLLKGSRSVGLERVVEVLQREHDGRDRH